MHVNGIPKDLSAERTDKNKYIEENKDKEEARSRTWHFCEINTPLQHEKIVELVRD
jgi:hypothetical protein